MRRRSAIRTQTVFVTFGKTGQTPNFPVLESRTRVKKSDLMLFRRKNSSRAASEVSTGPPRAGWGGVHANANAANDVFITVLLRGRIFTTLQT